MENFNQQLISTPVVLTNTWQPIGNWFDIDTYQSVFLIPNIIQNDSSGIKFRALISLNGSGTPLTKRIITTDSVDLIIPSEQRVFEPINGETNLTFKIPDGATECKIEVMADVVGATPGQITSALVSRNYHYDGGEKIEITTIRTDTASNPLPISLNSTTSTIILPANPNRNNVYVGLVSTATSDVFIKLQPASTDNDKKGILIQKGMTLRLFGDAVYTGEISGIANLGVATDIYIVEY